MGGTSSKGSGPTVRPIKWYNDLDKDLPSMEGKVVCITGSTTGTGFIAAKTVAKHGGQVVLLNRASPRVDAAVASIKEACPEAKLDVIPCDLQSFDSVRSAAEEIKKKYSSEGIDVLCNNAGIMAMKDLRTTDGYDIQMQTNHLSHFLLTKELLPLIEKAAERTGEARIVNHASLAAVQFQGKPDGGIQAKYFEKSEPGTLGGDTTGWFFSGPRWIRYSQTKLAAVIFTMALADRLKAKSSKVKALVAHPGLAATNLQVSTGSDDGMGPIMRPGLVGRMSQSPEDGAMGIITCVCVKDVQSGDYYGPPGRGLQGAPAKLPITVYLNNEEYKKILWEESSKAVGDFTI